MTFYRCDCGVAHGNLHTPWHENECHNCGRFPEFTVDGYQVRFAKMDDWYCGYYKSKESNKWYRFVWTQKIPSHDMLIKYVDSHISQKVYMGLGEDVVPFGRVRRCDELRISPEAAQMIKNWDRDDSPVSREEEQVSSQVTMSLGTGYIPYLSQISRVYGQNEVEQESSEPEPELRSDCSCDIFLLMQRGCQCGHFVREQNSKIN